MNFLFSSLHSVQGCPVTVRKLPTSCFFEDTDNREDGSSDLSEIAGTVSLVEMHRKDLKVFLTNAELEYSDWACNSRKDNHMWCRLNTTIFADGSE